MIKEKDLPDGWEISNLSDICEIIMGQSPPGNSYNTNRSGIPFFQGKAEFGEKYPTVKKWTTKPSKIAKPEAILMSVRAPVGDINFCDIECCIGRGLAAIKPESKIDLHYLYFYLKKIKEKIESLGTGSTFKAITGKQLKTISILVPPLPIQKKIIGILEKAEKLREWRKEADALSDEFLKSVFIEMFGDPVKNSKNWQTKKLGELCIKIMGGGTPSKSKPEYYLGRIPWVTPKDMKTSYIKDTIDHISEKAIKESTTNLIPTNSLLMVIRSGILKRKLPIAINKCEVTINQDMKAFIFKTDITTTPYMFYFFMNYQKYLLIKVRSVTADNLEFKEIKNINVILPPIELQNKFASIVEKVEDMRDAQKQSKEQINDLFNTLMQKAFSGELI